MQNDSNAAKWLTDTGPYGEPILKEMSKRLRFDSTFDRRIIYELIGK
jgi:hypothetical protein